MSTKQVRKLGECGLLGMSATAGGQRRYDAADVLRLAAWPLPNGSVQGGVAFHVSPLEPYLNPVHPRSHAGFAEGAVADGAISAAQEKNAWRGL